MREGGQRRGALFFFSFMYSCDNATLLPNATLPDGETGGGLRYRYYRGHFLGVRLNCEVLILIVIIYLAIKQ